MSKGKNSYAKEQLKILYGCKCLLTGIKDPKQLTYHHIDKREFGGKATVSNGANLIRDIHEWLHCCIEYIDPELFILINDCLVYYKASIDKQDALLIAQFENECQPLFYEKYLQYKRRNRR